MSNTYRQENSNLVREFYASKAITEANQTETMPKENPHYQNEMSKELIKVTLDYNKATGAITDIYGTLICNWEELHDYGDPPPLSFPQLEKEQLEDDARKFTIEELIQIINAVK